MRGRGVTLLLLVAAAWLVVGERNLGRRARLRNTDTDKECPNNFLWNIFYSIKIC